jgi:SpoVK/Ycf46/Vps4 family AAA+-type ATPase
LTQRSRRCPTSAGVGARTGTRDAAIDAAVGLTGEEAQACYARSLVQLRRIDPALVSREKRRVVARERVLEWFEPLPGGLDAVGGLDLLKSWLTTRKLAYSPEARAYGLPAPKGALLVGVPGTGKSL